MSSKYIVLWLEAPLQSWGHDSKFGRRDTLPFPTKSGIYGMYLAAMGATGAQEVLLNRLAFAEIMVMGYETGSSKRRRVPFLMDFQMVGSGYRDDRDHPWERLLVPKTAGGASAVGGGTKMTYRYYLQDACFAVLQELPDALANTIGEALQNPVYDLYLGRKNCVPTEFVFQGVFETSESAMARVNELSEEKNLHEEFRVTEGKGDGEILVLNDVPIQFGKRKKYRDRFVTVRRNA